MRILKFALYISLFICQGVFAQTTITISEAIPNNTEPIERIARDAVIMKPGFSYKALSTTPLRAALDKTLTGDQLYAGSSPTQAGTPDPNTPPRTLDKSLAVGSVGGAVNVSPSGSASYTVPISIPAGINGMQPSVNLVYSSQGGDGILGIGWNLSCASAISRTGHNLYFDVMQTNVLLTSDDPLCLDGMRLVCSDAGKKGLAGTNFKTEVDNNSLITQASGGFIVKTPDGKTMEYGVDATARFQVTYNGAITTVSWLLNKVTDANGISINYKYKSNASTGEVYLTSVEYANKKVHFLYMDRTDTWTGKLLTANVSRSVLLEKIEVYSNNSLLNTYGLKYNQENAISQLTEITQTNREGESVNATLFKWNKPQYVGLKEKTDQLPFGYVEGDKYFNGDFNGDGFEDLIVYRKNEYNPNDGLIKYGLGNNQNKAYQYRLMFIEGTPSGLDFSNYTTAELPRSELFNNFEDYLYKLNNISNCSGSTYLDFSEWSYEAMHLKYFIDDVTFIEAGDYNGDGKKEIIVGTKEFVPLENCEARSILYKMGNCFFYDKGCDNFMDEFNNTVLRNYPGSDYKYRYHIIDFGPNGGGPTSVSSDHEIIDASIDYNGDGKVDYTYESGSGIYNYYEINENFSGFNYLGQTSLNFKSVLNIDINGDGLLDFINLNGDKYLRNLGGAYDFFPNTNLPFTDKSGGGCSYINDQFWTKSIYDSPVINCNFDINNDGISELISICKETRSLVLNEKQYSSYIPSNFGSTLVKTSRNYNMDYCICGDAYFNTSCLKYYIDEVYSLALLRGQNGLISDISTTKYISESFICLDINGDGFDDLLKISNGSTIIMVKINNRHGGFNDQIVDIPIASNLFIADFNGDGNKELNWVKNGYFNQVAFNQGQAGYHITEIIDGMNIRTQISYKPLTDATVYKNESASELTYPLSSVVSPMYVVSSLKNTTGLVDIASNEIWSTTNYQYKNLLLHLQGRGMLGFEKFITTNENTGQLQKQIFEVNSPFYTLALKQSEQYNRDTLISKTVQTNSFRDLGNKRFRQELVGTVQTNNLTGVQITSTNVYDPTTGNLSKSTTVYGAGADITDVSDFEYISKGSSGNYYLPETITKTSTYNGQSSFVQKKFFSYDANGNLLTQVDFDNLEAAEKVTTTYSNYYLGLPQKVEKTAVGVQTAKSEFQYNALGQVVWAKDPLNLISTSVYDPITDLLLSSKDPLGNETKYYYNAWGQLTQKVSPLGLSETSSLVWAGTDTDAPANALLKKTSWASGQSTVATYLDIKGRELRSVAVDAFGNKVYSEKEYDNLGRVAAVSEPHFASEPKRYITSTYDAYGRPKIVTTPLSTTTILYSGLSTTSTVNGKSKTKCTNAKGNVVSATDEMGNVVTYTYHSSGQPLTITAAGTTTSMEYNNKKGLQTKLIDPAAGATSYEYDNFGCLSKQTDAKGNMFTMTYDLAGRMLTKLGMGCSLSNIYNSTTGLLETSTYTQPDASTHTRMLTYDKYGRTLTQKEVISGLGTYTNSMSYDALGRVDTKTYPSGFALKYQYSTYNGEQTHIKKASDNSLIWQLTQQNSKGQALKYSWGNGMVNTNTYSANGYLTRQQTGSNIQDLEYGYDEVLGNMAWRRDNLTSQGESFEYDDLNRLTSIDPNADVTTMLYAPNGNITFKSDVGNYEYGLAAKPHAVTKITNSYSNIPLLQQDVSYNAFGKVSTIKEGIDSLTIRYGMDNQRIEGKWYNNNSLVKSRIYLGDYEIHKVGVASKEIHYIFAPTGLLAVMVRQGSTDQLLYACTDHLGSLTALVNQAGQAVEKYSYDAWGRQRDPIEWTAYTNDAGILDRAYEYTGHETLAEFGLINMNGRVYDPVLGRMLSPDNYVQDPFSSQSYNRYTYCMNNPLRYIDPTGENWWDNLKSWYRRNIGNRILQFQMKAVEFKREHNIPDIGVGYNTSTGPLYQVGNGPTIYPVNEYKINSSLAQTEAYLNQVQSYCTGMGNTISPYYNATANWMWENMLKPDAWEGTSHVGNTSYMTKQDWVAGTATIATIASAGTLSASLGGAASVGEIVYQVGNLAVNANAITTDFRGETALTRTVNNPAFSTGYFYASSVYSVGNASYSAFVNTTTINKAGDVIVKCYSVTGSITDAVSAGIAGEDLYHQILK